MPITDNFNRADGGLGSGWETPAGFSAHTIVSNTARPSVDDGSHRSRRTEAVFPDDGYAQCEVTHTGAVPFSNPYSEGGPAYRMDVNGNCYYARLGLGGIDLYKRVSGTVTAIGGHSTTYTKDVQYLVRIECTGTTIKVYVDGVERISVTDSSLTSGKPGFVTFSVGAVSTGANNYDDYECTDAVPQPPSIVGQCYGYVSTGTLTPAFPAHQADDVILLVAQTANQTVTLSDAQGFASVDSVGIGTAGATDATGLALFWKRAAGTNETPPTFADPGDHIYLRCYVLRGCVTTGNPWAGYASDTASSATGVTWPSLSSTVEKNTVLNFLATPTDQRTGREFARGFLNVSRVGYKRGGSFLFQTPNFPDEDTAGRDVRLNLLFGAPGATGLFSGATNASLTNIVEVTDAATDYGNGGSVILVRAERATTGAVGGTTGTLATAAVQARFVIAFAPTAPALSAARKDLFFAMVGV